MVFALVLLIRCTFTARNVGRNMKVEDLVGHKVWVKNDEFRSVPGIISSVPKPINLDDFVSSVKESIFESIFHRAPCLTFLEPNYPRLRTRGSSQNDAKETWVPTTVKISCAHLT
jgi:hypothetical protein